MRQSFVFAIVLAVAVLANTMPATAAKPHIPWRLHLADYDAEPRLPNGRIDVQKLAQRLKEIHATTYYFLVLHAATDWDDLKVFLPIAARQNLEVWVYIVPPSESPPIVGNMFSEPFRLDFPKWAEEIAKLSLQHANLTAWVIDDFYVNHKLFTPEYIHAMQQRAKSINPKLMFLPLMYYGEMTPAFADAYHGVIDGAVVAYPPDAQEIERAWAILNDTPLARSAEFSFPGGTMSKPGDFGMASQVAKRTGAKDVTIHFRERDDFTGPTAGYHFKQLLLNNQVIWEEDVAGGTNGWREVNLTVPASALASAGSANMMLGFRMLDKKSVGNFGVRWQLADLKVDGLKLSAPLSKPGHWEMQKQGAFEAGFGKSITASHGRWHLPFIIMTAGQDIEFRLRHGDPASPERMNDWLRMCLQCYRDGKADGVVTYCLDKRDGSRVFNLARESFGDFRKGKLNVVR